MSRELALADLGGCGSCGWRSSRYLLTDNRPSPHQSDALADPNLFGFYAAIQRSFAWTAGALAAHDWLPWLRELPLEVRVRLPDGTAVLGVHATPSRDDGEGITTGTASSTEGSRTTETRSSSPSHGRTIPKPTTSRPSNGGTAKDRRLMKMQQFFRSGSGETLRLLVDHRFS